MIVGFRPSSAKYCLAEHYIGKVHRKAALGEERRKARFVKPEEAIHRLDHRRNRLSHMQRLAHLKRCLARLDRVDDVALDGLYVRLGQIACKHVHLGAAHLGTLALADELNAFVCRIGTLVELPGEGTRPRRRLLHLHRASVAAISD